MSSRSKAVCIMIALTVSVAVSVFFSIKSNNNTIDYTGEQRDVTVGDMGLTPKNEVESSGKNIATEQTEKYFLVIEENSLCAYRIISGNKEMVASAELKSLFMESEDIQRLKQGVYANNFEDLCLYFESYTS